MERLVTSPSFSARRAHAAASVSVFRSALMLVTLGYCGVLMSWLLLQPVPPLQDFGEWVFQGWAMSRILAGDAAFHARFALKSFPVPNLACQWLLAALSTFVGPFLAAKILIAGYCAGSVAVCWTAAKSAARTRPAAIFVCLLSLVAFNACFWHGYINYQIGLVVLLWYMQASRTRQFSATALFGLSVLLYTCHASAWIGLIVLVVTSDRFRTDRLRVSLALLPTTFLFTLYVLRSHAAAGVPHHSMGLLSFIAYKCYTLAKTGPFHNLVDASGTAANTASPWLYDTGVLLNLVFAGVLVACLTWGVYRMWRHQAVRRLLPFWCVMFLLFALMPSDLREVVNLGERFLYILLMSLLLTVGASVWLNRLGWVVAAGFLVTALQLPRASVAGMEAAEAITHEPETTGRAYSADGLFSHRLYQNDERRIEMRNHTTDFSTLLFDTSALRERDPNRKRNLPPAISAR